MDFTEKIKELIARGASIDEIASSFGLDVSVLPPEWILFFSNAMMLTCSMMAQLESFNAKMEGIVYSRIYFSIVTNRNSA